MRYIDKNYGSIISQEKFAGIKSVGGCSRVRVANNSLIIKGSSSLNERIFYERVAPILRENGVNIPNLLYSCITDDDSLNWVVIEDIPISFPKERWFGDLEMISLLAKLHFNTWDKPYKLEDAYLPRWDNNMSLKFLDLIPIKEREDIKSTLVYLQNNTDIFSSLCNINGDTNPTNWGIRNNQELVLFDWERFGIATPAVDLAITIPGVGSLDNKLETKIADKYLSCWEELGVRFPFEKADLIHQINTAKIWITLEFISNQKDDSNSETVKWFLEKLPPKIKSINKGLF